MDDRFVVHELRGDRYEEIEASRVVPEIDLAELARHALAPNLHGALKQYRDAQSSKRDGS